MNKHIAYESRKDLENPIEPGKIMVLPFYIFKFYETKKETLKKICQQRFDWQKMESSYPDRTTNCRMNWPCTYMDIKKTGYRFKFS